MSTHCACKSLDRYDCWALRYHHHTAVPGMVIDDEGGPCECVCHDENELRDDDALFAGERDAL